MLPSLELSQFSTLNNTRTLKATNDAAIELSERFALLNPKNKGVGQLNELLR
jgi:hypothetical protein